MDISASETVEVWLLESPQTDVPGQTTPSSLSLSERKKRRGSFFSKLFCSSDVERNGKIKTPTPSPAAETVDTSRKSAFFSSTSPLASPSESSVCAETTQRQLPAAMTTPPRPVAKTFATPPSSQRKPPAPMKTPGLPIPTPLVSNTQAKSNYRRLSEGSVDQEQSTDERCSFHSASEVASHEDDEFLPDEFKATLQGNRSSIDRDSSIPDRLYSADQVQVIVNEALHQAQEEWQETMLAKAIEEYDQKIAQIRKEAEALLQEHGNVWLRQHQDEMEEMRKKLEAEMQQQIERHEQEKANIQREISKSKEGEIAALQSTVSFTMESANKERDEYQKQVADLKTLIDTVQNKLAVETEVLRKELELSEAKNMELLDQQRDTVKMREIHTVPEDETQSEQMLSHARIAELERIVEERDRELQDVQNEALAEIQRLKDELLENERKSLDKVAAVVNSSEVEQRLRSLKLEHSQEIEQLRKDADLRLVRAQQDKHFESESAQVELISNLNLEWSKERQELRNEIANLEMKRAAEMSEFQLRLQSLQEEHLKELEQIRVDSSDQHDRLRLEILDEAAKTQKEIETTLVELNAKEKQDILDEIATLRLENNALKELHSQELERLRQEAADACLATVTKSEEAHRQAESSLLEFHDKEKQEMLASIEMWKTTVEALHTDHERNVESLQREHHELAQSLQQSADKQLAALKLELESQTDLALQQAGLLEQATIAKNVFEDKNAKLEAELSLIRMNHDESIAAIAKEDQLRIEQIRIEFDDVVKRMKLEQQQQVEQAQSVSDEVATRLKKEHQQQIEEMRNEADEVITRIKAEHERQILLVRDEATQAVTRAKSDYLQEIEQIRKEADERVARMKSEHLQQIDQSRNEADEVLSRVKSEHQQHIEQIREEADQLATSLRSEHQQQIERSQNEANELLSRTKSEHQQQIEQIRKEADELATSLRSKAEESGGRLANEAKEVSELIAKLEADLAGLRTQLDYNQDLLKQSHQKEHSLLNIISELEAKTTADRRYFELQLIERQELTNREIEETIAQLDLLVAEHNQEKDSLEKNIQDKDAIIAALGAQLAEAQRRMTALEEAHMLHARELEAAKHEAMMAQETTDSLKASMEHMKVDHKKALEAEHAKRQKAQEQAREETIAEAESQFQRANDIYIKLKKEYDASCIKISKLEIEVKNARSDIEKCRNDQASKEYELTAELAQVKARLATTEADSARQIKDYAIKLNHLQIREQELTAKLNEANASSRTTHMTLAAVVAEKERMIRENEEMKAVCEELMAMVEAQQLSNP